MYNIILVHIGDCFYDYIIDCINQIKKFENTNIYLLISEIHRDKVKDLCINVIYIEYIVKTEKHKIFEITTKLDRNFRGGFWKYATERFFYIEDVMIQYNLDNVFHMENDNLIYFNIDEYMNIFDEKYNFAAIFDNDDRCIPGFIFIKNVKFLCKLNLFIIENNGYNDMELIPMFNKKYDIIKTLPVIPKDYTNLISKTGLITNNPDIFYNNIDIFESVFDGAAIGQYLGGVDPRNDSSNSIGFINESSLYDISDFTFKFDVVNGKRIPYLIYNNNKYKINNLHIHSKKLLNFI